ncbi:MAG: SRPBCC family protein [Myxococcota bacterium]
MLAFLALLVLPAAGVEAGEPAWQPLDRGGEVELWVREVPGSPYPWFRARRRVRSSLQALVDLLGDARVRPRWFYACRAARSLEVREREGWTYTEIDAPWPARDRDTILHWRVEQTSSGEVRIELSSDPDRLPRVPGRVRLRDMRGRWSLVPRGRGEVEVTLDLRMAPETPLPDAFVLPFLRAMPFESLRALPGALAAGRSPSVSRWIRERETSAHP